jgi:hypothetical protein
MKVPPANLLKERAELLARNRNDAEPRKNKAKSRKQGRPGDLVVGPALAIGTFLGSTPKVDWGLRNFRVPNANIPSRALLWGCVTLAVTWTGAAGLAIGGLVLTNSLPDPHQAMDSVAHGLRAIGDLKVVPVVCSVVAARLIYGSTRNSVNRRANVVLAGQDEKARVNLLKAVQSWGGGVGRLTPWAALLYSLLSAAGGQPGRAALFLFASAAMLGVTRTSRRVALSLASQGKSSLIPSSAPSVDTPAPAAPVFVGPPPSAPPPQWTGDVAPRGL